MALFLSVGAFHSSSWVRPSNARSTRSSLNEKIIAIGAATTLVIAVVMEPTGLLGIITSSCLVPADIVCSVHDFSFVGFVFIFQTGSFARTRSDFGGSG